MSSKRLKYKNLRNYLSVHYIHSKTYVASSMRTLQNFHNNTVIVHLFGHRHIQTWQYYLFTNAQLNKNGGEKKRVKVRICTTGTNN